MLPLLSTATLKAIGARTCQMRAECAQGVIPELLWLPLLSVRAGSSAVEAALHHPPLFARHLCVQSRLLAVLCLRAQTIAGRWFVFRLRGLLDTCSVCPVCLRCKDLTSTALGP